MRGWYPIEVLHFPIRSPQQLERKGALWGSAVEKFYASGEVVSGPGAAYHALAFRDTESGRSRDVFDQLAGTEPERVRALEAGFLVEDTRIRDALRRCAAASEPLLFPRPMPAEDAAFAVEAAVLGEGDLIRVRRQLDELAQQVNALETNPTARLQRRFRSIVRRARGRA
jgi:hypothetical protein